jgi:plastocyanin
MRGIGSNGSGLILAAGLFCLQSGCATTGGSGGQGGLHGRVILPGAAPSGSVQSASGPMKDVVVYAVPALPVSSVQPERHARMTHTRSGFEPHVLAISVGTWVDFKNEDQIYHSPFSISPAGPFDLRMLRPGETRRVQFNRPGVLNVYCELHSKGEGFIVVVPDPAYTRPAPSGGFYLPKLGPGTYTVTAWHPTLGEKSKYVEVTKKYKPQVELTFRR